MNIEITKEEADAGMIQIGARLDTLKEIQKQEGERGNVERVIQMEEFMKPIRSLYQKIMDTRFK